MNKDTRYMIWIGIVSLITLLLIYSIPTTLVLEFAKYYFRTSQFQLWLVTMVSNLVFLIIVVLTAKRLMDKLLIFYGRDRLKRILMEI